MLLIQEGVTQGYPLLVVLYGITLVPLSEVLRESDLGSLIPFYVDADVFDGLSRSNKQLMKLLTEIGTDWGYFPEPSRSIFFVDLSEQEEEAKMEFSTEGLGLSFEGGSQYLGAYLGPWEELDALVKPKVEAWAHWVRVLSNISKRHPSRHFMAWGFHCNSSGCTCKRLPLEFSL